MGLVAPRHVGSSWTTVRTRVPYISRWILNHCVTRKAPHWHFKLSSYSQILSRANQEDLVEAQLCFTVFLLFVKIIEADFVYIVNIKTPLVFLLEKAQQRHYTIMAY